MSAHSSQVVVACIHCLGPAARQDIMVEARFKETYLLTAARSRECSRRRWDPGVLFQGSYPKVQSTAA